MSPLKIAVRWMLAAAIVVLTMVAMFFAGRSSAADVPAQMGGPIVSSGLVDSGVSVLALLLSIAAFFLARRDKHSEAAKNALAVVKQELDERIDDMEDSHSLSSRTMGDIKEKMARVEEALKHIPTQHDLGSLQTSVTQLSTNVAELKGAQETNNQMVHRMNQYLMERGT